MVIQLPYGRTHLTLDLPDEYDITVIEPVFVPSLPEPGAAVREALRSPIGSPPLHTLVCSSNRVGIIFNDITRPTPNSTILHAILDELASIPGENITLFNALGTHRPNTTQELRRMLDDELVNKHRIVQNNAFDPTNQVNLGKTRLGNAIWLNRELYECDVKILTGFIEPHLFAGFSGGGKAILPGMAGLSTILENHNAQMIAHPQATWGITQGNPIWEEIREVAKMAGKSFLLNVTLNKNKEISGVFCGNLDEAHARGCVFVKQTAMIPVAQPFDIIITTNSGYPLDLNLYQSVKGMSAAAQVVRPGGAIIIAIECSEGIPEHGLYGQLLRAYNQPGEVLDAIYAPGLVRQDQWQVQLQALIQLKADVYVRSDGLSDEQIRGALLIPCQQIELTVSELVKRLGPQTRICVLPEGPQTIPYVAA